MARPGLSVLQLDTRFPRVLGDIGNAETFSCEVEIITVPGARVAGIVTGQPEHIDIAPFERALGAARGDVVVTSCGFLAYWQDHLQARLDRPFLASALAALPDLARGLGPADLRILTFDDKKLNRAHLGGLGAFEASIRGLRPGNHLRRVIEEDAGHLDAAQARRDVLQDMTDAMAPGVRHLLLECTNLPPYKAAMRHRLGVQISDILTLVEHNRPGTIQPAFL